MRHYVFKTMILIIQLNITKLTISEMYTRVYNLDLQAALLAMNIVKATKRSGL